MGFRQAVRKLFREIWFSLHLQWTKTMNAEGYNTVTDGNLLRTDLTV